jgi:transcriptional regulator with XRE-family HTH domain
MLSAQIGVNVNYLAKLAPGEVKGPAGSIVWRLAQALGVSTDYLLDTAKVEESERMAAAVA